MALLGNYSVLHKSPGKFLSGTTVSGDRANWNKPGMMRSMGAGSGNDWTLAAIPNGFGAFGAWMLPKTAGGMTSRRMARLVIDALGVGILGRNIIADGLITIDGTAIGALIAAGIGDATITITGEGDILATAEAVGSATIIIDALAELGALGWLIGNSPITIDGDLVPYAIGWMEGTTAEGGLTPTGIANAVWNAIAASLNNVGTMGEKMNSVSSVAEFLFNMEGGKWKIVNNQMIFYEADNTTEVARFDLYNAVGIPSMTEVYERRRV